MDNKDSIPLIPTRAKVGLPCPDTSTLLRDVFQENLGEQAVRSEDAQYIYQNAEPKDSQREFAKDILNTHDIHAQLVTEIGEVECDIFETHARHLLLEDKVDEDPVQAERVLLTRPPLFCDAHSSAVDKYCLMTSENLLPAPQDAIIDFRVSDFARLKVDLCQAAGDQAVKPPPALKKTTAFRTVHQRRGSRLAKLLTDRVPPALSSKVDVFKKFDQSNLPVVFVPHPALVVFSNFKSGVLYKSTVKFQNVSMRPAKFDLVPLLRSRFMVEWVPLAGHTKLVAAGMAVGITVSFRSKSLDDCQASLDVRVRGGQPVTVMLAAIRDPPDLRVPGMLDVVVNAMSVGQKILLTTVECGRCFVGNTSETVIRLINVSGDGRFWICSEEQWCSAEIDEVYPNNTLYLPPFEITPVYFSMKTGDTIDLRVVFTPTVSNSQVEKLYIMCDNCSARTLEVCGDGLVFHIMYILFKNLTKEFCIDVDDDEDCEYWLKMGSIIAGEIVSKTITIKNTSDIKLPFRWEERNIHITVFGTYASKCRDLPEDGCNIRPREGVFGPREGIDFTVTCRLGEEASLGPYRHVLRLYIENIPELSVQPDSGRDLRVFPSLSQPGTVPTLDILVGEVEIWLSCISLYIQLDPCVVWVIGEDLKVGGNRSIVRRIGMTNERSSPVTFAWESSSANNTRDGENNVVYKFRPSSGVLAGHGCLKLKMGILGIEPGRFKKTIRCSLNGGVANAELSLRGEVAGPIVVPTRSVLDFGLVKVGSRATAPFSVVSKTTLPATWLLQELSYDFANRRLHLEEATHMSVEAGFLCHRGNRCDVAYDLCTRNAGIQCSVLVLSTPTAVNCNPQAYIMVVAEVVEPQLNIRARPRETAVLIITTKLYVGHRVQQQITLRNLSKVEASFMWGEPTGCDMNKLKVTILPRTEYVDALGSTILTVYMLAQETGAIRHFYIPCFTGRVPVPIILSIQGQVETLNVTFDMPRTHTDTFYTIKDQLLVEQIPWSTRGRDLAGSLAGVKATKTTCQCKVRRVTSPVSLTALNWDDDDSMDLEMVDSSECELHHQGLQIRLTGSEFNDDPSEFELGGESTGSSQLSIEPSSAVPAADRPEEPEVAKLITKKPPGGPLAKSILRTGRRSAPELTSAGCPSLVVGVGEGEKEPPAAVVADVEDPIPEKSAQFVEDPETSPDDAVDDPRPEKSAQFVEAEKSPDDAVEDPIPEKSGEFVEGETSPDDAVEGEQPDAPIELREITAYCQEMQPSKMRDFLATRDRDVILILKPKFLKVVDIDEVPPPEVPTPPEEPPPPMAVSRNSLLEWLRSHAVMVFNDVPVNKPIFQTFVVRNETPIEATFTITATNYPAEQAPRIPDVFEEVCASYSNRSIDKWAKCMRKGSGLVVMANPARGLLRGHQAIPINVLVYADTWGCYREKLVCSIVGLPPFAIQMRISVYCHPITFPMMLNSTNPEPVLRFGCVAYRTPPQQRRVRVCNSSSVAVSIAWNTFVERVNNEPVDKEAPISVVLDLFTPFDKDTRPRGGEPKRARVKLLPSVKAIYSDEPLAPPSTLADDATEVELETDDLAEPTESDSAVDRSTSQYVQRGIVMRTRPKNAKLHRERGRATSAPHAPSKEALSLDYSDSEPSVLNTVREDDTPFEETNGRHETVIEVLSRPYLGVPDRELFKVHPSEIVLEPHTETQITVSVDPSSSVRRVGLEREDLCGVAVGSVRAHYDDCYGHTFYRPSGMKLPPARLRLEVALEVPELELRGDLNFRVHASWIFTGHQRPYMENRSLFMHNNRQTSFDVSVNACKPFTVKYVTTRTNDGTKTENRCTLLLGECAEVVLELVLEHQDAINALQAIQALETGTDVQAAEQPDVVITKHHKSVTFARALTITQQNVHEQTFNLTATIVFPVILVETEILHFGPVYAKETKHCKIWIQNKCEIPLNFRVTAEGLGYSVTPVSGILPPTPKHIHKAVLLDVGFHPRSNMETHGRLLIETDIPDRPVIVLLRGHRTLNEKYKVKGV